MFIAIDFDGTIVEHKYPDIGPPVPGAFEWMKTWKENGANLILYTMRWDSEENGPVLTDAIEFCLERGIHFFGINENPLQHVWSKSPKAYAHIYVDDTAFGCPLVENPNGKPYVDWKIVGPSVLDLILNKYGKSKE